MFSNPAVCVWSSSTCSSVCVCLFWTPVPPPSLYLFSHCTAECLSLSLGPSIIPRTRLLGTNLVFLSLSPAPLQLSASACTWTASPLNLHLNNKLLYLFTVNIVPYFPLSSLCCQKNAGVCSALQLNWSRKLFHCNKRLMITAVMRPYCTCQDESNPLP